MLLLQSPVLLLLLFFLLLLLLVVQVAMKIDIREGGVSFGICSRRIVAGAAASRRGGGSDAAWQLNCSLEQSTSNRDPLTDHLLNTSAFFLYTHSYINNVELIMPAAASEIHKLIKKKKKINTPALRLRTPEGPKVPLLSDVDGWRGGKFFTPNLRKKRSSHGGWMKSGG